MKHNSPRRIICDAGELTRLEVRSCALNVVFYYEVRRKLNGKLIGWLNSDHVLHNELVAGRFAKDGLCVGRCNLVNCQDTLGYGKYRGSRAIPGVQQIVRSIVNPQVERLCHLCVCRICKLL